MGNALGRALSEFKKSMNEVPAPAPAPSDAPAPEHEAR